MFLPVTEEDMKKRGWSACDFVLVSGDAYVDHPSFGPAVISRILEDSGYRVGIIAQPDWQNPDDFTKLGEPELGFLVTSGNMDSMVNKYTSSKKVRNRDSYSPGGRPGMRPDRSIIVYTSRIKQSYKEVPVILGGIEATLRRLGHYDYWSGKIRKSVLLDSKADIIVYGMAENTIIELARKLARGTPVSEIEGIRGTVVKRKNKASANSGEIILPSFSEIESDKGKYSESFKIQYQNTDALTGKRLIEKYDGWDIVQNPPSLPLTTEELDRTYSLPYTRNYHPSYEEEGGIPALDEVKFSIISSRGCFGGCNYCALNFIQGRTIQARSHSSIINEAKLITEMPGFKGYIHDVGGPTANFRKPSCAKQLSKGVCINRQCLYPSPCEKLEVDHKDYIQLLKKIRELPGIKKVFIRSGIRYDYLLQDKDTDFLSELTAHHVSGQLKVAPEHVSGTVLAAMGRPGIEVFEKFALLFKKENEKQGKKQYIIPYLISGHPGSELKHAIELAEFLRDYRFIPDQVQDFYPTPGTLSTCMYYTGNNPLTGEKVHVPDSQQEKAMQRALLHFNRKENFSLVYKALITAGRNDLIGYGKNCLIPPPGKTRKRR